MVDAEDFKYWVTGDNGGPDYKVFYKGEELNDVIQLQRIDRVAFEKALDEARKKILESEQHGTK